jgi:hypothetical protein
MSRDGIEFQINYREVKDLLNAFNRLDKGSNVDLRKSAGEIAEYAKRQIQAEASAMASARGGNGQMAQRVADTGLVVKKDRLPKIKMRGKRQVFSGGGTVEDVAWGAMFGSNNYKQFPARLPKQGKGNKSYFMFSTLSRIHPKIVRLWQEAVNEIADKWTKNG